MARQVLPIVGAVVGGIYGGPQGAQIGFAIGSVVGNAVDPQRLAGPKIGEVAVQTAEEGAVCPLYAGTCAGPGNLIYKHLFDPVIVEEQQGKGGGPIIESERLYGTFAIRIGASLFDGPGVRNGITGLIRIWEDEKLVYDVSPTSVILDESAEYANGFTFYAGTETQLPDPDIEAIEGVGNVPAYRGRAYIVFNYKDLTDRKGSVPQFRFEVTVEPGAATSVPSVVTNGKHYEGTPDALTLAASFMGWGATMTRVAASPDGQYAAGSVADSISASRFQILKWGGAAWSALPNPSDMPVSGPRGIAWSPDGNYLALAIGQSEPDNILIYRRDGDVFTKLPDPVDFPIGPCLSVCWDSSGQRIAFGAYLGAFVYDFVDEELVGIREANANFVAERMDFLPGVGSRYLACGNANRVYVAAIEESPVRIADIVVDIADRGIFWDASGGYLFTIGDVLTNPLKVYRFDYSVIGSESLTLEANFADQPATNPSDSAITDDRQYLMVATDINQSPYLYSLGGPLPPTPVQETSAPANGVDVLAVDWAGLQISTIVAGTSPLPDVIEAIVKRVKQPATIVNTDQVSSEIVRGLVFGSQDYTATDAIRSLAQVYLFDVADYDEQLHLIPRGGAVSFSVTEDDLAEAPSDSFVRANAIEQPGKISLFFQNPTIYYQPSKVNPPFIGYENGAVNEVTIQVPVVLNEADEAPQLVDKMQKINEVDAQGEITRVVSDRYLSVVPGSIGALTERGITRRVRVTGVEEYDYRMKLKMRVDRQSAVTSNLTVTPTPAPDPPPPSIVGDTVFAFLNIPGISDTDDKLGYRFAVSGIEAGWRGAALQRKSGAEIDFTTVATKATASVMGTLMADVPAASEHVTDYTNVVRVYFPNGETIDSLTYEQFLSEGGGFAISNGDGTWELCQYQDAATDSDGIVELSTLIRGRGNTGATAHTAGAQVVMLSSTQFVEVVSGLIGLTLSHRPVSTGASPETATIYPSLYEPAYSQVEMPVSQLRATRSSANVLTITWAERRRFGTVRAPVRSLNWLGFRVVLTKGATTVTLPDQTTDSVNYDATALGSNVTVSVYQINRITGLGPASEVTV